MQYFAPLSGWAVPPVEWAATSKEAAEANAPPSNPRPSLPILSKGPISKILSLYQDHCILCLKGINFGSTNVWMIASLHVYSDLRSFWQQFITESLVPPLAVQNLCWSCQRLFPFTGMAIVQYHLRLILPSSNCSARRWSGDQGKSKLLIIFFSSLDFWSRKLNQL